MKIRMGLAALSGTAWLALSGCSSGDPLDRYTVSEQTLVDSYCGRCWMSGGWSDEQQCRGNDVGWGSQAFYGDLSDTELACMRGRYVADAALDAALGCMTDATNQLVSCIQPCTNSPDDMVASDCYDAYAAREMICLADSAVAARVTSIRDCAPPL